MHDMMMSRVSDTMSHSETEDNCGRDSRLLHSSGELQEKFCSVRLFFTIIDEIVTNMKWQKMNSWALSRRIFEMM